MVAGMGLGIVQTVTTVWSPAVAVVVPYLALVVVLLWRPQGLAGKRVS
jgi:branched-chain amino acid transport system permease protein